MGRRKTESSAGVADASVADRVTPEVLPPPEPVMLEALFKKHQVPAWARAGLCQRYGWKPGDLKDEKEFVAAMRAWRNGPVA